MLNTFLNHLELTKSKHTRKNYEIDLKQFKNFIKKDWKEVKPEDIEKFLLKLKRQGMSDNTLARKYSSLRSFYEFHVQRNNLSYNPVSMVERPKTVEPETKYLTEEEVDKLLNIIDNVRDKLLVHLMVTSGLRVGEVTALNVEDVEGNQIIVRNGKGRKKRIIPMHPETRKLLDEYLDIRYGKTNALFVNKNYGRFSEWGISLILKKWGQKVGIDISPHMLRHTFATRVYEKSGHDLLATKELLGHSRVETTQRYAHVTKHLSSLVSLVL